jgi:hypothetical protein
MYEVISSNSKKVAITAYDNNFQLWIGKFHSSRKSQGSSMCRVKRVGVRVSSRSADAANARYDNEFVKIRLKLI